MIRAEVFELGRRRRFASDGTAHPIAGGTTGVLQFGLTSTSVLIVNDSASDLNFSLSGDVARKIEAGETLFFDHRFETTIEVTGLNGAAYRMEAW